MCCWNYASATPVDLFNLAFFLYSSDGVILKQDEVLSMLRQIFGDKVETNPQARKMKVELLVICEQWNCIDLSQYGEYCKKHMSLLEPCFHFQKTLQTKCLGTR